MLNRMSELPIRLTLANRAASLDEVRFHRAALSQQLSDVFELRLLLTTTDHNLSLDELIGETVVVELPEDAGLQSVRGIIRKVEQQSQRVQDDVSYELTIVPPTWLLSQRIQQRIFRDLSAVGILRQLLTEHGLPAARVEPFRADPPVREYTVQHRESDLTFVRRLLAEQGITFWFDHGALSQLVISDDTTSMTPLRAGALPFLTRSTERVPGRAHVEHVTVTRSIHPGRVTLRDYNFETPLHLPEARAIDGDAARLEQENLERYEYEVGEFSGEADGVKRATQLLEEQRAFTRILQCDTSIVLSPGTRFVVAGHPRDDVDGELLVVSSTLTWSTDGLGHGAERSHRSSCMAASTPFRPSRLEKPRIWGTQSAFVVCPEGKEVDVDKHGRVNLMFRWDRRDSLQSDSSRRVRVSQGWAGANYGFLMIPRVGNEVLVSYLDGDPDEPIIVGRVHNEFNRSPLDLPAQQTQSIWKSKTTPAQSEESFNMIRMEDAAGAEMLEFRAQLDSRSETLRNADTVVGVDQSAKVGGSSKTEVAGPYSLQSASTSIATGAYNLNAATIDAKAATDMSLVAGATRLDESKNHNLNTSGFWVKASSVVQVNTPHFHAFCGEIHLQAGGSSIHMTSGGIDIKSGGSINIESGADVTVNGSVIKLNC